MFAFFRTLGETLGIAIGGNIFQNALSSRLAKQPLFADHAAELAKDATAVVQWMRTAAEGEAKDVLRTAFTDSMRIVYIVMAGFALAATAVSLFVKHYDLDRALETEQYLVEVQERPEEVVQEHELPQTHVSTSVGIAR